MKALHGVTFILVIVGALNWGLVGLGGFMGSDWNVVNMIVGNWPMLENLVYVLVGLSGIALLVGHKADCRACGTGQQMGM